MPIYEYRCPECAYELEILQKMGEDAPTCTMCIKEYTKDDKVVSELHRQMKRKLSNIAPPVFKGSGFYATDYKKKGFSKPDKKVEKSKGKKNEGNKKNKSEVIRIQLKEYKEHKLIDIRVWYEDEEGEYKPTKKGISFNRNFAVNVANAITEVLND